MFVSKQVSECHESVSQLRADGRMSMSQSLSQLISQLLPSQQVSEKMSSQNILRALPKCAKLSQRAVSTSAVKCSYTSDVIPSSVHLPEKDKPIELKFGSRERLTYGMLGEPHYNDVMEFPCSAIRFREDTPEVLMLREKEKGDWKNLTIPEIKTLYRANFCQTYAEMTAPTGEWKGLTADILFWMAITLLYTVWMDQTENQPLNTETVEWRQAMIEHYIIRRRNPISGISSWFDYETGKFKPDAPYLKYHRYSS
ncbi:hypothetical protein FSP39_004296 [Pinctada imbricata]|uniref:Cytochrome c oxidase subunit 4 n=1 Tax=Pinctada imbricata TaxID=66713 RepID=A0AA88XMF0_PINIB|nr:hypothetical protein FSP39_004296 [Pinctada imbricata]